MGSDDGESLGIYTYDDISIHAPVWGATTIEENIKIEEIISIHAPVWGATCYFSKALNCDWISIHAPVWGATFLTSYAPPIILYFNSRSRVGSDHLFQKVRFKKVNFNSRSRVGSD